MAKVSLDEKVVFSNVEYVRVTPWVIGSDNKLTLDDAKSKTYDLTAIVGDTLSIEQADNETNAIESELTDAPLIENITLGEKTFSLESIDMQNKILVGLFGWTEGTETEGETGSVYAPVAYEHLYAMVEIAFHAHKNVIVLPKVLLNSRAVLASMKTDVSRANITGTCYAAYVDGVNTDMAILNNAKNSTSNTAVLQRVTNEKPM